MHAHRFHLPTLELKKLARLETREPDAITRRRTSRHERQAADQADAAKLCGLHCGPPLIRYSLYRASHSPSFDAP